MTQPNKFEIDTGTIFHDLNDDDKKWKLYDREFLKDTLQAALELTLINNRIVTANHENSNESYLENHRTVRYPDMLELSEDPNQFPFPEIFLLPDKRSPFLGFVSFREHCIINKDDYQFDLFFALQFSLTEIVSGTEFPAEQFLEYHLQHTFENNIPEFKRFLKNLCIKYESFLKGRYEQVAREFIENVQTNQVFSNEEKDDDSIVNVAIVAVPEVFFYWPYPKEKLEEMYKALILNGKIVENDGFVDSFRSFEDFPTNLTVWKAKPIQLMYLLFLIYKGERRNSLPLHTIAVNLFKNQKGAFIPDALNTSFKSILPSINDGDQLSPGLTSIREIIETLQLP